MKDCLLVCLIENPRHSHSRLSSSTKARSVYLRSSPAALNQLFSGCCASGENAALNPSPAHWEQGGCEHRGVWNPLHRRGAHRAPAGFACWQSSCLWARDELPATAELPFALLPKDTVVQLLILRCKTPAHRGFSSKIRNLITFGKTESYKAQPRFLPADNMSGNIMHKGL